MNYITSILKFNSVYRPPGSFRNELHTDQHYHTFLQTQKFSNTVWPEAYLIGESGAGTDLAAAYPWLLVLWISLKFLELWSQKSQWLVPLPALTSVNRKIVPPLLGLILNI